MSIQNFPQVSVDTAKFDLPVFTPAVAPVRIPTKTYDLVVSLGTDVHTFDRLLRWVEAYLEAHPQVTCLVQHGHTAPIKHADNLKLLPAAELLDYYANASVVLVQRAAPVPCPWPFRAARSLTRLSITIRSPSPL